MPSDHGSLLTEEQRRRRASMPRRFRGLYEQAVTGSRKAAVRVHCLECCAWQSQDVQDCSSCACPLYPYRMGSPDLVE